VAGLGEGHAAAEPVGQRRAEFGLEQLDTPAPALAAPRAGEPGKDPEMPGTPEGRLQRLGIVLPEQLPVLATYRLARRHRGIVYLAGHVPAALDGSGLIRGRAGAGLTLGRAREAARICALHMLSALRAETGSLDQVAQILKVPGMVNVAPGFADGVAGVHLANVLDGCANQLTEVFGNDAGIPARVAVGMAELPPGAAVETEMTVALHH
jgi:enamine deaminase RidA (YjgF/YER057c/UK114 family)